MLSICARHASRDTARGQLIVVHRRTRFSLVDLDALQRRTLGLSKFARKVTHDQTWDLVALLRNPPHPDDTAFRSAVNAHNISLYQWSKWSPALYSPSFQSALDYMRRTPATLTPSWVILALAAHKVESAGDAESLFFDLVLPLTSSPSSIPPTVYYHLPPLFVLCAHALAHFALESLLRPLSTRFVEYNARRHVYRSFYFNMFLQAITFFHKSKETSDVAIYVLKRMDQLSIPLWVDTEIGLIGECFVTPDLASYLGQRKPNQNDQLAEERKKARLQAWLQAHATLGNVKESAQYLNAIREYCVQRGLTPPYPGNDVSENPLRGSAQVANNEYLRAMRKDQKAALRYLHHLLGMDLAQPNPPTPSSPSSSSSIATGGQSKTNIDIYDWTTALNAGALDNSLSARDLLQLFGLMKSSSNSYSPTRVTYTVVLKGLLRKGAFKLALGVWEEYVSLVVGACEEDNKKTIECMAVDRYVLCVGIDVLMQNGLAEQAIYLLEQALEADLGNTKMKTTVSYTDFTFRVVPSLPLDASVTPTHDFAFITTETIHVLLRAVLKARRPDVAFYIWSHLTSLYFVSPTTQMLQMLLKAAMQASQIETKAVEGATSHKNDESITPTPTPDISATTESSDSDSKDDPSVGNSPADTPETPPTTSSDSSSSREPLVKQLIALFKSPLSGASVWEGRPATAVARSIFRGMMLGNWPALTEVVDSRGKTDLSAWPAIARIFSSTRPNVPRKPLLYGERPKPATQSEGDDPLGPPLPTVQPSESTFCTYISLLGVSSHAEEIPEVLMWMRALGLVPQTQTLAIALVFWSDEMDWRANKEFLTLRSWILDWVGQKVLPRDGDIDAARELVANMRGKRKPKSRKHEAHLPVTVVLP